MFVGNARPAKPGKSNPGSKSLAPDLSVVVTNISLYPVNLGYFKITEYIYIFFKMTFVSQKNI